MLGKAQISTRYDVKPGTNLFERKGCAKWCSMRLKDIISKLCLSTCFRPGIFRMKIWGYVRRIGKGGRGSYLGCREKYSEITARKHDDWRISWTDSPHILHIHSLAMYLVVAKAQHSRKALWPESRKLWTHYPFLLRMFAFPVVGFVVFR